MAEHRPGGSLDPEEIDQEIVCSLQPHQAYRCPNTQLLPGGVQLEEALRAVGERELGEGRSRLVEEHGVVFDLAPIDPEIYCHRHLLGFDQRPDGVGLAIVVPLWRLPRDPSPGPQCARAG